MAKPNVTITGPPPDETEQAMLNWVTDVAQFMIDFQERHNRVATGESIDGYDVKLERRGRSQTSVFVSGVDYISYALQGRGAGNPPPSSVLEQWIRDKGLVEEFGGEDNLASAAYGIAVKISKEGTLSGTGPDDTKLNPGLVAAFASNIGKKYIDKIADYQAKNIADKLSRAFNKPRRT